MLSLQLPWCAGISFRAQQNCDFPFKDRDVGSANVFGVDTAIAAYKESDWQSQNSSVKFASLGIAHYYRIIHLELLVEVEDGFRTIVHGNANNLQALISILVLQFHKMRDLFPAGIAPGCPEVQQNHTTPVVRKMELLSTQLRKRKVRS